MNKRIKILFISGLIFCLCGITAFADMGSKPRVEIELLNKPENLYYLDLLYEKEDRGHSTYDNIEDKSKYNAGMLDLLFSYKGWYPAYAGGTWSPMWGDLTADETGKHIFNYVGVPDRFRVIIVTEDGSVSVSEIIDRKTMEIKLTMDYNNMDYTTQPVWKAYMGQFLVTCSLTLIVELIVFILFRFKIKNNLKTVVFTNIFTQIVFSVLFSAAFLYGGTLGAIGAFVFLEIGVVITETIVYRKLLKNCTKQKSTLYAVTANFITAMLTWVNLDPLMAFMFKLIR